MTSPVPPAPGGGACPAHAGVVLGTSERGAVP